MQRSEDIGKFKAAAQALSMESYIAMIARMAVLETEGKNLVKIVEKLTQSIDRLELSFREAQKLNADQREKDLATMGKIQIKFIAVTGAIATSAAAIVALIVQLLRGGGP